MPEGYGNRTEAQEVDSCGYFGLAWLIACLAIVFVLLAVPAAANGPFTPELSVPDFKIDSRIDGAAIGDWTGVSVDGAGDVNGDGRDDVIVGSAYASNNGRDRSGSAYVVFDKNPTGSVDLSSIADNGFRIDGAAEGDGMGLSVAGTGDVNGDGLADVIVGAPRLADNERSGSAYVIFGRKTTETIDLANDLGSKGFRIDGVGGDRWTGFSVAGAGDVNGDGLDDTVVSAPLADNNARLWSGSAYVIYGPASSATIVLNDLGNQGFRIDGAGAQDYAGYSVAGAGDVNGDGRDDVIVGAPGADVNGANSGSAYVIFDKDSIGSVDLNTLGESGFRIDGTDASGAAGTSVAGAGDVNGDGRDDVVVGAPYASNNGRTFSGSAYLIYGNDSTDTVDLETLGAQGFRIDGAGEYDFAGSSVAGPGDINGDGLDDVMIGAPGAGNNGSGSGSAYVIYGDDLSDTVNLERLEQSGFRIDGGAVGDALGTSVAGAGDVMGNGGFDLIVGAPYANNNGREKSGSAYIVHGYAPLANTPDQDNKTLSGAEEACTKSVYENRLEAPREARLADLVKGKGVKVKASANRMSMTTLKLEVVGEDARRLGLYGRKSSKKNKLVARTKLKVGNMPEDIYLKARGKVRKLVKRVLRNSKTPKRVRLKLTLTTHSTSNKLLARRNTLTIRAYKSTRKRNAKTNARVSQMHGGSGCAKPLQLKIKGPKKVGIGSLISRNASQGKGVKVKVLCSEDCTARVGIRMWGRFEVGSGLRERGKKKPRWLTGHTVKLKAGQTKTITLKGPSSKRLRRQLQRAALKKRYKRIKLKYSIEARTIDEKSAGDAGTLRVPLRFG